MAGFVAKWIVYTDGERVDVAKFLGKELDPPIKTDNSLEWKDVTLWFPFFYRQRRHYHEMDKC